MKKLLIGIFTNIGFMITFFYGVLNSIAVIDAQGNFSFIGDFVLGLDVLTWHIYAVISVLTLLIKLGSNRAEIDNNLREKWLDVQSVFHFVFMLISFGGIYYLFENCF